MAGKTQNDPHLDFQIADALATGLERFAETLKGLRRDETVPDTAATVGGIFGHKLLGLAAEIRDDAAQLRDAHNSNAEKYAAAERAADRPPIDTKAGK